MQTLRVPTEFTPRPHQIPILKKFDNLFARITIMICHRRFGKDVTCLIGVLMRACKEPGNYWYAAPTIEQAKKVLWSMKVNNKSIFNQLPPQLIKSVDNQRMRIELVNGSVIQFVGLKDGADSLVGIGAKMIVVSEATLTDESTYAYLLPVVVMDTTCSIVFNGTPRPGSWVQDLIEHTPDIKQILSDMRATGAKEQEELNLTDDEYEKMNHGIRHGISQKEYEETKAYYEDHEFIDVISYDVHQTGLLSGPEYEMTRQSYITTYGTDNLFRQEFLLDWNAANINSIYGEHLEIARNEGRVAPLQANPNYPINVSLDLGLNDLTVLVFWQKVGQRLIILDEYENRSKIDEHYANYILRHPLNQLPYKIQNVYLPHDSKNMNSETGRSRFEYYTNVLPQQKIVYTPKTDSVQNDIMRIRGSYFQAIYFNPTDSVKRLLKQLENYDYIRGTDGQARTGKPMHSDHADAFRYAVLNGFEDFAKRYLNRTS